MADDAATDQVTSEILRLLNQNWLDIRLDQVDRPHRPTDGSGQLLPRAQRGNPDAFAEFHAAPGPTDADRVSRMAADVRKAFETNYPCHWQNLLGFVHQECRSLDDYAVEDVANEAILRVWQELIRLGPVDNLSGYLKTIAKNIVARRFRNKRPDEVALSSDIVAPGFSPCETCERDEVSQLVAQAARSLPKSHRVALEYNQTGLSAREIAARLGCTENAARLLVQKGRRELARLLSRCGDSCALDDCRPSECPGKEKNLLCLKSLHVR